MRIGERLVLGSMAGSSLAISMKRAFLFPGQGSQYIGMLAKFKNQPRIRSLINTANDVLGFDLERIIEEGREDELRKTSITQPALLLTSMAHWYLLQASIGNDNSTSLFMGHSIGEYAALVARESLTFESAISLVSNRGRLMEEFITTKKKTGMAVMTPKDGSIDDLVRRIKSCSDLVVDIAAINSEHQITISGVESDMMLLRQRIGQHGFKILSNVSLPFHSRFMSEARNQFHRHLHATSFAPGNGLFLSNATGKPEGHEKLPKLLSEQITSTVLWKASIDYALGFPEIEVIEVGPRSTLSNMLRKSGISNKIISTSESSLVTNGNSMDPL